MTEKFKGFLQDRILLFSVFCFLYIGNSFRKLQD